MIYIDFKNIDIMGVVEGGSGGGDLSNYYTKSETDTKLNTKADKTAIPDISTLATKTELATKADKTEITNLDNKIGSINTMLDEINGEII